MIQLGAIFSYIVHSNWGKDFTPYFHLGILHLLIQNVIFVSLDRASNVLHLHKKAVHLYNQQIYIMLRINRNY